MKLPCQFCGQVTGFLFGRDAMYRCVDCGTVLCDHCLKKAPSLSRSALSLALIGAAPATSGLSLAGLLLTGFTKKRCLKCSSKRVKDIS